MAADRQSGHGIFASVFSKAITEADIANIAAYNKQLGSGISIQEAFDSTMQTSTAAAKNYVRAIAETATTNAEAMVSTEGLASAVTTSAWGMIKAKAAAIALNAALAAAAALAVVIVVKCIEAIPTFEKLKEKAEESRKAYEDTASEIESLNEELDTTRSRIAELGALDAPTLTDKEELQKLEVQNERLERQLEIKQKLAAYQQNEAAEDAKDVLTHTVSWESDTKVIHANTEYAESEYGDIIDRVKAWYERRNQREQRRAELEAELAAMEPETSGFLPFDDTEYEKKTKQLENVGSSIEDLDSKISEDIAEIQTQYESLFDSDGNVISGYEDIVKRVESVLDEYLSEENAEKALEEKNEALFSSLYAAMAKYKDALNDPENTAGITQALEEVRDIQEDITSLSEHMFDGASTSADSLADDYDSYVKALEKFEEIREDIADGKEYSYSEMKSLTEELPQLKDSFERTANGWTVSAEALNNTGLAMAFTKEQSEILQAGYGELGFYIDESTESYYLSADALQKLGLSAAEAKIAVIQSQIDISNSAVAECREIIAAWRAGVQAVNLYEAAVKAIGNASIYTRSEFNRRASAKEKYGTYEDYIEAMLGEADTSELQKTLDKYEALFDEISGGKVGGSEKDKEKDLDDINEKLKELDDEARLDNIKKAAEEFTLALNGISDALDILNDKLEMSGEKDFFARSQIYSEMYSLAIAKGEQLRAEFDRVKSLSPQTADEANEIASELESIGSEMRSNVKSIIEYRKELALINVNALSESADAAAERLDDINNVLDNNEDVWWNKAGMHGYASAFDIDYLLPSDDMDKVLDRTRSTNDKIAQDEQETQDAITEIKRKAIKLQYEENAAAREKSRQELYEDLDETKGKYDSVSDSMAAKAQSTADSVVNSVSDATDKIVSSFDTVQSKAEDTANKIAESFRGVSNFDALTGGLLTSGAGTSSSNKSGAISTKKTPLLSGDKYATGSGGCVTYVRSWLKNNGYSTYIPTSGAYDGVDETAKTKHNGQSVSGENIEAIRSALGRGAVFAVSAGPNVSSSSVGHLLVVTGYNPQSDVVTVSEHCYTKSKGDWIETSDWKLENFLKAYTVTWTTPASSYAEGTRSHPGGLAIVGEDHASGRRGGAELAKFPNGSAALLGVNGAGLYDLPKGTQILSHDETKRLIPSYAEGTSGTSLEEISLDLYSQYNKEEYKELVKRADEYKSALESIKEEFTNGAISVEEYGEKLSELGWDSSLDGYELSFNVARKADEELRKMLDEAKANYLALLGDENGTADTIEEARQKVREINSKLSEIQSDWKETIDKIGESVESYFEALDKVREDTRAAIDDELTKLEQDAGKIKAVTGLNEGAVNSLQGSAELIDNYSAQKSLLMQRRSEYISSYKAAEAVASDTAQRFAEEWGKYFSGYDMYDILNPDGSTNALFQTLYAATEDGAAQEVLQTVAQALSVPVGKMKEYTQDISDAEDEILSTAQDIADEKKELVSTTLSVIERYYDNVEEKIQTEIDHEEYLKTLSESRLSAMEQYHELLRGIGDDMVEYKADLESSKLLKDWLDPEARSNLFNEDDYEAMESAAETYSKEISSAYKTYLKQINSVKEGEEAYLEIYSQEYSDALEAAERTYALSKLELDVAKKKKTLENAVNERNVRQFIGGRWVYTSNADDVMNAQKELTQAETEYAQKEQEIADAKKEAVIQSAINEKQSNINDLEITSNKLSETLEDTRQAIEDNFLEPLDELSDVLAWVTNYDYDNELSENGRLYKLFSYLQGVDPTILTSASGSPWGEYPDDAKISSTPNYMQAMKSMAEEGYSRKEISPLKDLRDEKLENENLPDDAVIINGEIYRPITSADMLTGIYGEGGSETAFRLMTGQTTFADVSSSGIVPVYDANVNKSNLANTEEKLSQKITEAAEYMVRELVTGLSAHWLNIDTVNVQDDKFSKVMKTFDSLYSVKMK